MGHNLAWKELVPHFVVRTLHCDEAFYAVFQFTSIETDNQMVTGTLEAQAEARHCVSNLHSGVVFLTELIARRLEEVERGERRKCREACVPNGVCVEPIILHLA